MRCAIGKIAPAPTGGRTYAVEFRPRSAPLRMRPLSSRPIAPIAGVGTPRRYPSSFFAWPSACKMMLSMSKSATTQLPSEHGARFFCRQPTVVRVERRSFRRSWDRTARRPTPMRVDIRMSHTSPAAARTQNACDRSRACRAPPGLCQSSLQRPENSPSRAALMNVSDTSRPTSYIACSSRFSGVPAISRRCASVIARPDGRAHASVLHSLWLFRAPLDVGGKSAP